MKNIKKILNNQIKLIKPRQKILNKIQLVSEKFCKKLNKKLKKRNITAEIFVGGSLAKNTIVKKDRYDIDIFIRFSKKYNDNKISSLLGKVLGKEAKKIHGSRDYYQIYNNKIIIEIIPVLKIKRPRDSKNITDLSYFHVKYVLDKIKKNKKISDEIRLAKTFAYAHNCYGAESYIHGFSGYALELLICHYENFLNFIKTIANFEGYAENIKKRNKKNKKKPDEKNINKIIIDDKKFYKNKREILIELNESKLQSPIILIDPSFKQRNALAGLNKETFIRFQKVCRNFLKNPDAKFFEKKDIGTEMKEKYKNKLIIVSIKTNKQAGDIAGTKSKKFFNFFINKLKKEFKIKKCEFDYNEKSNIALFYFVLDKKKQEIVKGPCLENTENFVNFKKAHKNVFIKKNFIFAKLSHNINFKQWFEKFLIKDKKIIRQMSIKKLLFSKY